eukprot:scaffold394904_cov43-Prasinocladus_malaysianus.AAC.1
MEEYEKVVFLEPGHWFRRVCTRAHICLADLSWTLKCRDRDGSKVVLVSMSFKRLCQQDPDALFLADAPAAVIGAGHPRVNHDTFNSGAFVLKPSRETFFDMMAQVGGRFTYSCLCCICSF